MAKKVSKKRPAKTRTPKVTKSKQLIEQENQHGFVFIGVPYKGDLEYDPLMISYRGYKFELNGKPVPVTDRVDYRFFQNHKHFKEV